MLRKSLSYLPRCRWGAALQIAAHFGKNLRTPRRGDGGEMSGRALGERPKAAATTLRAGFGPRRPID